MTTNHPFIFLEGVWLGEGTIRFSASDESLRFFTRWNFEALKEGEVQGVQRVEMSDVGQTVRNQFRFYHLGGEGFLVDLHNELIGMAHGKGVVDEKRLAWEFRCPEIGFEGFEVYELSGKDEYHHHAEYTSGEQMRTLIKGKVWKQAR